MCVVEMMAAVSAEATERGGGGGDTSSIVASKFTLSQSACDQGVTGCMLTESS